MSSIVVHVVISLFTIHAFFSSFLYFSKTLKSLYFNVLPGVNFNVLRFKLFDEQAPCATTSPARLRVVWGGAAVSEARVASRDLDLVEERGVFGVSEIVFFQDKFQGLAVGL
jgi:hypothetical protein